MNHVANGEAPSEEVDEDEKEENHLDRILQSSASRRLFSWGTAGVSSSRFLELTEEMKQEQRLRWNFDFESETPLPGRYQWVRTGPPVNGHHRNGTGEPDRKRVRSEEDDKQRTTRQAALAQILRVEKRPPQSEDADTEDSMGSRDTTLNRPQGSSRSLRMHDPSLEVDWN